MTSQTKNSLLAYHSMQGFKVYDSFPLIREDNSVLFTTATINPFKPFFEDPSVTPHNFALAQKCLRVKSGSQILDAARGKPNYASLFEMFGSGLFDCSIYSAVNYFVDMLVHIGLPKSTLRFVVPQASSFSEALVQCGIEKSSLFPITKNGDFRQEWQYGENGLLGRGITVLYSPESTSGSSGNPETELLTSSIEIGNLIHIYGKIENGQKLLIPHEGFEAGIGISRIAMILQNKTLYELSPYHRLTEKLRSLFLELSPEKPDEGMVRVTIDHLRSINALIQEGLSPNNKRQAYILRKLIRSLMETTWLYFGRIFSISELVLAIATIDTTPKEAMVVQEVVSKEEELFLKTLAKGKRIVAQNPDKDLEILKSTYGIRPALFALI